MDPDANLAEQRELVSKIFKAVDESTPEGALQISAYDAWRLAELVDALDGWIRKGGQLPGRWANDVPRVSP